MMFAEEKKRLIANNWHKGFKMLLAYHSEITHDKRKKINEITIPLQIVKENKAEISFFVRFLFWIIAGEIPISVKILKKFIITVAIATIPKSSGDNNLDKTAVTKSEITIAEYLAIAV